MTLQQFIDRARAMAIGMSPDLKEEAFDRELFLEITLPSIIDVVVDEIVLNEENLHSLMQDHSISLVTGVADLPTDLCIDYLPSAVVIEEPTASFIYDWYEFDDKSSDYVTDVWTIRNKKIYYVRRTTATPYTATLTFSFVTKPSIPTSLGNSWVAQEDVVDRMVSIAATVIAGNLSITDLLGLRNGKK